MSAAPAPSGVPWPDVTPFRDVEASLARQPQERASGASLRGAKKSPESCRRRADAVALAGTRSGE